MPIHGLYLNVINCRSFVVLCERLDPSSVVVSQRYTFRQLEHSIQTVL